MDIDALCISEKETLLDAMKQLDKSAMQILFVSEGRKLLATLTDGDIRRFLLNGGKLTDSVNEVAVYQPHYVYLKDAANAKAVMIREQISSIPVVNDLLIIEDVIFLSDVHLKKKKNLNIPVVIMAGGKGKRLYPYTKVLPKPLIPIGDLPITEHIMKRFNEYGCTDFHYIVHHKKQMIKAYFAEEATEYQTSFYDEEKPLGTGGGLSLLKENIKETFFLTNCDSLLFADYNSILEFHKENKNLITMVCVYKHFVVPYGVITMGENGAISGMEEKPEQSFLANTGFYVVEPEVLPEIEDDTVITFVEIINKLQMKNQKIGVYPVSEASWLDMGQPDEMEKMLRKLGFEG
ncbi:MAG: sugar phosphate nucleotidyltransferase [Lachnospiraceae bacterium]|nr:sugar phosphate nucleotidyltransferase [Lachnospiraceae bacterium]